jgi:hypothetical protein
MAAALTEANARVIADASTNLRDFVYIIFCPFKKGVLLLDRGRNAFPQLLGRGCGHLQPAMELESSHVSHVP